MTAQTILAELKSLGNDATKKMMLKHGAQEPLFGVKIEALKVIEKKVKKDYQLAKDLYASGNADAMYLAGLIADETKMTKKDLEDWVKAANSSMIIKYTVPWIAAESKFGYELALKWIMAKQENIATAGWSTLSNLVTLVPDSELDLPGLKKILTGIEKTIHTSANDIRSTMNGFIIAAGSYVAALHDTAISLAGKIGAVTVIKEGTACKTPDAKTYIAKAIARGSMGKKKKNGTVLSVCLV